MASTNTVENLKKRLFAGGLSQQQIDNIVAKIKAAGGSVNLKNYPAAGSTEVPAGSKAGYKDEGGGKVPLNQGGGGGTTTPPADPAKDPASTEGSVASAKTIAAAATEYGDSLAKKYITDQTFGTIDAATSPAMKNYLDGLRSSMRSAGNLTGLENESIAAMRAGLAGYDSPEVQAMRESALAEIQRSFSPQLRAIQAQQARGLGMGAQGGSGFAQTADLKAQERGLEANLERDLLVKNADEVQKRKETFANLIRETEDARFGRKTTAQSLYGSALAGEEAAGTAREQFNIGQKTNTDTARASLAMAGAGTFAGMQQGAQSTAASQAWNDYLKQWNADQMAQQEKLAKLGWQKQKELLDKQLEAIQNS